MLLLFLAVRRERYKNWTFCRWLLKLVNSRNVLGVVDPPSRCTVGPIKNVPSPVKNINRDQIKMLGQHHAVTFRQQSDTAGYIDLKIGGGRRLAENLRGLMA